MSSASRRAMRASATTVLVLRCHALVSIQSRPLTARVEWPQVFRGRCPFRRRFESGCVGGFGDQRGLFRERLLRRSPGFRTYRVCVGTHPAAPHLVQLMCDASCYEYISDRCGCAPNRSANTNAPPDASSSAGPRRGSSTRVTASRPWRGDVMVPEARPASSLLR